MSCILIKAKGGINTYTDQLCYKIQYYPQTTSLDEINKAPARLAERVKNAKPVNGTLERNNCVELYGQPGPEDDHAGVFPDSLGGGKASDSGSSSGSPSSDGKKSGASSLAPIGALSGFALVAALL
ncbi:hypothetical protein VHEMI04562 [[Torrubiella] hemipterigena]|uniref:Uncharacterized protein n=1 Tax=[Torrubiella] hemipterigena TaxID=1531966 RepID=A0A0A1T1P7_9HYPO|nr:hypothetical protein VHEMI04562 [[Torrubiella] hemipterigena]